MPIALVKIPEAAAGQGVALDVVDAALLDFSFMFGRARATGRDQEPVVLGALAVAALHFGIVQSGVHNGGAQIVEHDPTRHRAEELQRGRCRRVHVSIVWSKTSSAY